MEQSYNEQTKIVFFGTHDFATTILQAMIDDLKISVDLVITQPDKPVGRKRELQQSPVKKMALKNHIQVQQPQSLTDYKLQVTSYNLAVVAQYGELIPQSILDTPTNGTLNVHTSLLPKYRGASPIQSALINGETETGVTIIKMDEGLDTGPIIIQKSLEIDQNDTYPQLSQKLAKIGSEALLEAIPGYISGKLQPTAQDVSKATSCKQLSREDGQIDWLKSAEEVYNQYRGMTPWPGVWTVWGGKRLKLLKIKSVEIKLEAGQVKTDADKLFIGCGEGAIEVFELQLEGKKVMNAMTFLNGYGETFDSVGLR
jgi:methionyl-tRNA formyltransferase